MANLKLSRTVLDAFTAQIQGSLKVDTGLTDRTGGSTVLPTRTSGVNEVREDTLVLDERSNEIQERMFDQLVHITLHLAAISGESFTQQDIDDAKEEI